MKIWFTIPAASTSLARACPSPADKPEISTGKGVGANRAAMALNRSRSGTGGAGLVACSWAAATKVQSSRNKASMRMRRTYHFVRRLKTCAHGIADSDTDQIAGLRSPPEAHRLARIGRLLSFVVAVALFVG